MIFTREKAAKNRNVFLGMGTFYATWMAAQLIDLPSWPKAGLAMVVGLLVGLVLWATLPREGSKTPT